MLFNSYIFIFVFFPVTILGYFFWGYRKQLRMANIWLVVASLLFYGYWDIRFLPLLLGSIAVNYFIAGMILSAREQGQTRKRKLAFLLGLAFNISLLCYYKYLDFFLETLNLLGGEFALLHILLPLGISFFTITQLLYLLDCNEGVAKDHDLVNYVLFVSFFPHLLAGPILYHMPMMKQFRDETRLTINWENMSRGLSLFVIGLVKKVLIADQLSGYVAIGYSDTNGLTLISAWLTAISYMLQLYYDFSGYSDMAVGLAQIMNIKIPINFNSPYRANNLISFWQRWHISLTNAITACIYMPMIKRFGTSSFCHVVLAIFVTFFLVGIWHGAGWTYVVFALMHSIGLVVNHAWKHYHLWMSGILSRVFMIFFVLVSMVFFRAQSVSDACTVLFAMAGGQGVAWPQKVVDFLGDFAVGTLLVGNVPGELPKLVFVIAICLVFFSPNSNELVRKFCPSYVAVVALVLGGFGSILLLSQPSEFLYFQF